ncbi:cell division protein FtsA [Roseomonas sp. CECT 9278]|uniref:cell division protein FtsA n=1 Tax=Roseomonas sp. CECT 9278 TaxID=2845823 RepID=UPI001E5A3814|nr:cell division protein FtsA [Roseomonas sp. CECT 9278]CAH0237363.1 Cell division protein FtsA [Roseomonas sp. CECT 9278]
MNQMSRLPPPIEPGAPPRRRRHARSGTFGVLDIGSTKAVCMIARIESDGTPRVLGFGWRQGRGVKGGSIVDLEEAERAIRAAVGQAEEMADTRLPGVIVNLSCGQPDSRQLHIQWGIGGRAVTDQDLRAILHEGRRRTSEEGRETVHAIPLGFTVDATPGVDDPRSMICDTLGARLHMVSASQASLRNLGACLLRCDLEVEELVSAPFAAGLATLVDDEKQLGATVIDMGGGTTSLAVFSEGHLVHTAQVAIGGGQVTNDLATVLATPLTHAERIKTLHGSVHGGSDDDREFLPVPLLGEDEHAIARIPRSMVVNIIKPRLEETFELVRERLDAAALGREGGTRVVLTGGGSQMVGAREMAARILDRQVRIGRPLPVRGLAEAASGPGFASAVGLLLWGAGEGRPVLDIAPGPARSSGAFRRFVNWVKDRV